MKIHRLLSFRQFFFLFGFLITTFLAIFTTNSFVAHALPPTKIMVVGDSISQGSAGDWTWRYRLWQHFQATGTSVDFVGPFNGVYDGATQSFGSSAYIDTNFGQSGDRQHNATAGRTVQAEKSTIYGHVSYHQPDILLILMGVNDIGYANRTAQQADSDMRTLITNARNAKPNVKIVLSKITPSQSNDVPFILRWLDYNDNKIPQIVSSMSTQTSPIVLADAAAGFNPDPAVDTYDNTHPSPSGEYKIAKAFADALASGFGVGTSYGEIPPAPAWPLAPTSVTVTPVNGAVNLSWSAVAGANSHYIYYRNVSAGEVNLTRLTWPVTGTSFTQTGLVNGQTYEFAVSTVRVFREGPTSPTVQATPVAAPVVNAFSGATIVQGNAYNRTVSFTDPDSTAWTATVNYGDGSAVEPLTVNNNTVVLSHVYATSGSFTVTVAVQDNHGLTATKTATVTAVPLGSIHTLSPTRILDTRTTVGGHPAIVAPGESFDLRIDPQILAPGGVPVNSVSAVIVNVAVVPGSSAGFLTLYPTGSARSDASTINFVPGIVVANQALIRVGRVGQDNKITIYNPLGSNHVVIDVQGWVGTELSPDDGKVASFSPVRILDTRPEYGGQGPLGAGQTRTLSALTALNNKGIEISKVKAIIANVTGVPSPTTKGFLIAYPYGTPVPTVSTTSLETAGVVVANLALVPVGTDGKINIYNASGTMNVVVDVQAVVIEDDGLDENGQPQLPVGVHPVDPARILDTRGTFNGQTNVPIGPNQSIHLPVLGVGGIPASGVSAVIVHMTAVSPTASGFLTVYPKGIPVPTASNLNFTPGKTVSNNVLVPVGADGSISIYNAAGSTHVVADVQGWVASQ